MASHRDAYDSRSRGSHRTDSFARPTRTDAYLTPTAGPYEKGPSQGYGGERRSGGPDSPAYTSSRASHRHSYDGRHDSRYDPRYSYPEQRSKSHVRAPSRVRKRRSYPPQPSVEDEVASLRKEAGTERLVKQAGADEVRSRGKIDQEPIIEDVLQPYPKAETRPVSKPKDTGLPTPPSSEDERRRKADRRPSKLDMSFKDLDNWVPEMSKRASTPYSFTRSAQTPQPQPTSVRFASNDYLSPPQADRRPPGSKSQPSSPRRDSARYSPSVKNGTDYFTAGYSGYSGDESAIDEADYDTSDPVGSSGSRKQTQHGVRRPMQKKPDEPRQSPATNVVDFAAPPPLKDVPIRRANLDARRNTDTTNTLPTFSKPAAEKTRKPTPLALASALNDLGDSAIHSSPSSPRLPSEMPLPRSREPSYASSRGPSPCTVPPARGPGQSPRLSSEYSREQSSTSSPASKAGSANGSRPSSPSPRTPGDSPRLPRTDLDWSAFMAQNAARKPKNSSRLASSQLQMPKVPEFPEQRRPDVSRSYSAAPPVRSGTMPYPSRIEPSTPDASMPSERTYQYFPEQSYPSRPRAPPEKRATLQAPIMSEAKNMARTASSSPYGSSHGSSTASSRLARPGVPVRHSTADVPQVENRRDPERPGTSDSKRSSYNGSSYRDYIQPQPDLQALMQRRMKPCKRPGPVAGCKDWYTLRDTANLDFCPSCVRDNFDGTRFRKEIRDSPQYNPQARIQCALGGDPWIRLALLLTIQRERPDLTYLRDLSKIDDTSRACPGNQEDPVGPWYGLRNNYNNFFIADFRICFADVRKIERLFSTLDGQLVRKDDYFSKPGSRCSMRPGTNRFFAYLSALNNIHMESAATRKDADITPFVHLVEAKLRQPECTRDEFKSGCLWHFIPSLPEFTVCTECYETIVVPEQQKRSDLPRRFNASVQPAPRERTGTSCQLYSPRMRKIFYEAVYDDDLGHLARYARERRDMEVRLQDWYRDVSRRKAGLRMETVAEREEEKRLIADTERIADHWARIE